MAQSPDDFAALLARVRLGDEDALAELVRQPSVIAHEVANPLTAALASLDLWIVDALRYTTHPSHFSVDDALQWIGRLKPRRAILTNLHADLDYEVLRRKLPPHVEPGFDGISFETADSMVI